MDGTKIFDKNCNISASIANNAIKRIIFKNASGVRTRAQIADLRCIAADPAWDGKVHFKAFNRAVETQYNVNKFVTALGVYSIHLDEDCDLQAGGFSVGDKVTVSGSTAGTNDGVFTISSIAIVDRRVTLYVVESVTGQTASPAVLKNTVATTHFPLYGGESRQTIPMTCSEIHVMNVDAVGAIAMSVYVDAYSDEDISGTTFA